MPAHLGDAAPLWSAFKEGGCRASRSALIDRYTYLVRITVGRVAAGAPETVDRREMLSAGSIGLIQAVDRFDPGLGFKFETLAITRIRGAILDFLREQDWAPRGLRRSIKTVERAKESAGRALSDEELATITGLPLDGVMEAQGTQTHPMQLSAARFRSEGGGETTYDDVIAGNAPDPYESLEKREQADALRRAVAGLPPREKVAVTLYYYEGKTCREVGDVLGVSEKRAHQILVRAVGRTGARLGRDASLFATA